MTEIKVPVPKQDSTGMFGEVVTYNPTLLVLPSEGKVQIYKLRITFDYYAGTIGTAENLRKALKDAIPTNSLVTNKEDLPQTFLELFPEVFITSVGIDYEVVSDFITLIKQVCFSKTSLYTIDNLSIAFNPTTND